MLLSPTWMLGKSAIVGSIRKEGQAFHCARRAGRYERRKRDVRCVVEAYNIFRASSKSDDVRNLARRVRKWRRRNLCDYSMVISSKKFVPSLRKSRRNKLEYYLMCTLKCKRLKLKEKENVQAYNICHTSLKSADVRSLARRVQRWRNRNWCDYSIVISSKKFVPSLRKSRKNKPGYYNLIRVLRCKRVRLKDRDDEFSKCSQQRYLKRKYNDSFHRPDIHPPSTIKSLLVFEAGQNILPQPPLRRCTDILIDSWPRLLSRLKLSENSLESCRSPVPGGPLRRLSSSKSLEKHFGILKTSFVSRSAGNRVRCNTIESAERKACRDLYLFMHHPSGSKKVACSSKRTATTFLVLITNSFEGPLEAVPKSQARGCIPRQHLDERSNARTVSGFNSHCPLGRKSRGSLLQSSSVADVQGTELNLDSGTRRQLGYTSGNGGRVSTGRAAISFELCSPEQDRDLEARLYANETPYAEQEFPLGHRQYRPRRAYPRLRGGGSGTYIVEKCDYPTARAPNRIHFADPNEEEQFCPEINPWTGLCEDCKADIEKSAKKSVHSSKSRWGFSRKSSKSRLSFLRDSFAKSDKGKGRHGSSSRSTQCPLDSFSVSKISAGWFAHGGALRSPCSQHSCGHEESRRRRLSASCCPSTCPEPSYSQPTGHSPSFYPVDSSSSRDFFPAASSTLRSSPRYYSGFSGSTSTALPPYSSALYSTAHRCTSPVDLSYQASRCPASADAPVQHSSTSSQRQSPSTQRDRYAEVKGRCPCAGSAETNYIDSPKSDEGRRFDGGTRHDCKCKCHTCDNVRPVGGCGGQSCGRIYSCAGSGGGTCCFPRNTKRRSGPGCCGGEISGSGGCR